MAQYDAQPDLGALIVFKEGVSEQDARRALQKLDGLIENAYGSDDPGDLLRTYDRNHGGPVWYIP